MFVNSPEIKSSDGWMEGNERRKERMKERREEKKKGKREGRTRPETASVSVTFALQSTLAC